MVSNEDSGSYNLNTSKIVKVSIPNELGYETIPIIVVGRLAHNMGFSPERIEYIQVMVSEATIQAIAYGRQSNVEIAFFIEPETLRIKVVDIGPPPLYLSESLRSDIRDRREITIYNHVFLGFAADTAKISSIPEGNEVEMVFYLGEKERVFSGE